MTASQEHSFKGSLASFGFLLTTGRPQIRSRAPKCPLTARQENQRRFWCFVNLRNRRLRRIVVDRSANQTL
jgi:hypothetical protein